MTKGLNVIPLEENRRKMVNPAEDYWKGKLRNPLIPVKDVDRNDLIS